MRVSTLLRSVVALGLSTFVLGACRKDATAPTPLNVVPQLAIAGDTVIGTQGSIRVVFGAGVNRNTALNPGNFVVINTCTGLPVPGSLRFSGDTLVFTPGQTLPFLTGLSVRIQGILDANDQPVEGLPKILFLRTQNPPVSDVSWQTLTSPTSDQVAGVTFLDRNTGWISTITGGVYRTDNSGGTFAALFKSAQITSTRDIRSESADSLYMVGSPSFGGSSTGATALFRSIDGGRTFQVVFSDDPGNMTSLALRKRTGLAPEMVMGGSIGTMAAWRYDQEKDSIARFGPVGNSTFGNMADLSADGANAALVGFQAVSQTAAVGVAYRSNDGGRTYVPVTLPNNTHLLRGLGFINNTDVFLLGDTSTVLRLNTTTGTVTALGASNGIPQTETDPSTGATIFYLYTRARFAPDDPNTGWIIGTAVRHLTGQPDVRRGIILITRDGGATFTRQAVSNAPENGLGFPELRDIFVLNKDFQVVVGSAGFIAARKSDTQNFAGLCSFKTTE